MMFMNLFENFDPATSESLMLNWFMLFFYMFFLPYTYWLIPSRINMIWFKLMLLIFKESKNILNYNYKSNIIKMLSLMMMILTMNIGGLMPYMFVITSNMSFNLLFSFSIWLSLMIYVWFNEMKMFLSHLVPLNTPKMLMNFMVYIELISNLIRPLTLSIRLTANLIAGHLLMTLLGLFMLKFNILNMFMLTFIQNLLLILEISMAFIQAYVYYILMILYLAETK